jgi:hypothetical protein
VRGLGFGVDARGADEVVAEDGAGVGRAGDGGADAGVDGDDRAGADIAGDDADGDDADVHPVSSTHPAATAARTGRARTPVSVAHVRPS